MTPDQILVQQLKAQLILLVVCRALNVSEASVMGDCRKREFVYPRHLAMALIIKHTRMTFREVGKYFCGREHTSITNANDQMISLAKYYPEKREEIIAINKEVLSKLTELPVINNSSKSRRFVHKTVLETEA